MVESSCLRIRSAASCHTARLKLSPLTESASTSPKIRKLLLVCALVMKKADDSYEVEE